ncbi:hypothetical protein TRIP_C20466 [Candidatus Zixiibacteriota bacterium]|nr:hypothetical protein TRIP_C20466 [candidate division Zixibacteria bacterium]
MPKIKLTGYYINIQGLNGKDLPQYNFNINLVLTIRAAFIGEIIIDIKYIDTIFSIIL